MLVAVDLGLWCLGLVVSWACGVLVFVSSNLPRDIVLVIDVSVMISAPLYWMVTCYLLHCYLYSRYTVVPHAVTLLLIFATRRTCLPPYPQNDLSWRDIRIFPGSPYP